MSTEHSFISYRQHGLEMKTISPHRSVERPQSHPFDRHAKIAATSAVCAAQVDGLIDLALKGLPRMHQDGAFGHTLRAGKYRRSRSSVKLEGDSLRYTAIVALGMSCLPEDTQRTALGGKTASELARICVARAEDSKDLGAITLAAWAAAEAAGFHAAKLFRRLNRHLVSRAPIETVSCAWALTAALAAGGLGESEEVLLLSSQRLMEGQSRHGVFPHMLPAQATGRLRGHIGCFADQVYPIQALSRLYVARGQDCALMAAEACAAKICALQGPAGQWWWHYDIRDGNVVEGYPVYSVHQHGMGPMVLMDLMEAGGKDHSPSISRGLQWLHRRPELAGSLVDVDKGVIWRKVARREPSKAVRGLAAMTTAASPGLRLPGLDFLFPPSTIDHECRPYELGWLLYAWLSGGTVARLSSARAAVDGSDQGSGQDD